MKIQESGENYLESILILHEQTGAVRSIDVANYFGFSKPSVSRAVGILKASGYIDVGGDGIITLTDLGRQKAGDVYERHQVLCAYLKQLGVPEGIAVRDACRIEHVISEETFQVIKAKLEGRQC